MCWPAARLLSLNRATAGKFAGAADFRRHVLPPAAGDQDVPQNLQHGSVGGRERPPAAPTGWSGGRWWTATSANCSGRRPSVRADFKGGCAKLSRESRTGVQSGAWAPAHADPRSGTRDRRERGRPRDVEPRPRRPAPAVPQTAGLRPARHGGGQFGHRLRPDADVPGVAAGRDGGAGPAGFRPAQPGSRTIEPGCRATKPGSRRGKPGSEPSISPSRSTICRASAGRGGRSPLDKPIVARSSHVTNAIVTRHDPSRSAAASWAM